MLANYVMQVTSKLHSFNFIHDNENFIMNYQLLHSFEKQKHKPKIDGRYNFSSLSRYKQQQLHQSKIYQQFSFQSPMPIKLVHYKPQSRTLPDQLDTDEMQRKIHCKVKQKKVYLPSINKKQQKLKAINRSYQPTTHKLLRKQLETQTNCPDDSEYTIVDISQINDRQNSYKRSNGQKQGHRYKQRNLAEKQQKNDQANFHSNVKQREFEQYVHQLQKKYSDKKSRINIPQYALIQQQVQIQKKLKNRVQTKKYTYCKQFNPEISQNQKEKQQQTSLSHLKPSKNTYKQQIEQEEPQINLQTAQSQEEVNRQRKRHAINDEFLRILRKAKNRGASLLIKLKKYPSKRLIAQ